MTSDTAHDHRHDEPPDPAGPAGPVLPAPRTGGRPVETPAGREEPADPDGSADGTGPWSGRAREARARLVPERAVIPAPRAGGVDVPPPFGRGAGAAPDDLVRDADALIAQLVAVENTPDETTHRVLLRVDALLAAGVPDRGWSTGEDLGPDVLADAAELAGTLHAAAAALLERLDAAELPSPAVVVDALTTSLRVTRMVVELEVFARTP